MYSVHVCLGKRFLSSTDLTEIEAKYNYLISRLSARDILSEPTIVHYSTCCLLYCIVRQSGCITLELGKDPNQDQ